MHVYYRKPGHYGEMEGRKVTRQLNFFSLVQFLRVCFCVILYSCDHNVWVTLYFEFSHNIISSEFFKSILIFHQHNF